MLEPAAVSAEAGSCAMSVLEDSSEPVPSRPVSAPCSAKVFAAVFEGTHIDFALHVFGYGRCDPVLKQTWLDVAC